MKKIEDIKKIAKKCLKCKKPICVEHCPINNPIPEILKLVDEDKLIEASKVLFNNTNGAIICSSLCDFNKQCYGNCVLSKKINGVEFFEVEKYLASNYQLFELNNSLSKESVAVIGAGISGISVAIDLAKDGYKVTIFEKKEKIGGVIVDSLPSFRYDEKLLDSYYEILDKLKIEVKYGFEWGNNLKYEDLSGFKYIIMAIGTYDVKKTLPLNGKVFNALKVLQDYKRGLLDISNQKILVIGGGNIAIDASRVLKRLGNEVSIVYRRDIQNAPASIVEINHAINEGVHFLECLAPSKLVLNNNNLLVGLEVEKMNLVESSNSVRKTFEKTNEFKVVDCDLIVEAIGLKGSYDYTKEVFPELFNEKGWIDENTELVKNNQIIMATGDYLTGPSSFVNALRVAKQTVRMVKNHE